MTTPARNGHCERYLVGIGEAAQSLVLGSLVSLEREAETNSNITAGNCVIDGRQQQTLLTGDGRVSCNLLSLVDENALPELGRAHVARAGRARHLE